MYLDGGSLAPAIDRPDDVVDVLALLGDRSTLARQPGFRIEEATDAAALDAYRRMRRDVFVREQGLFEGHDRDDRDDDPRTVVLVARDHTGTIVGGVRLGPAHDGPDIGWWVGGRLVVAPGARGLRESSWGGAASLAAAGGRGRPESARGDAVLPGATPGAHGPRDSARGGGASPGAATGARGPRESAWGGTVAPGASAGERGPQGVGSALVRAACARAEAAGALRFEATVQAGNEAMFRRLGWLTVRQVAVAGTPHVLMRWPIGRIAAQAAASKAALGRLLGPLLAALTAGSGEPAAPGVAAPAALGGPAEHAWLAAPAVPTRQAEPGAHAWLSAPAAPAAQAEPAWLAASGALGGAALGGAGFVGDDGAPVPGCDLVAACDAIVPAMVERDPEWAGWCSVLVNVNDLAAMGAIPVGLLDALGARDASHAARVLAGLRRAADAYGVPVLGGHTQLGVPAALAVTALGRTDHPVPGGGGRPGHAVRLTADLGGDWRPGYRGRQWDSTTHRRAEDLRAMLGAVAAAGPAAAKDVSMAGIVGTLGMLAEASGCAAILDVAAVPRPPSAAMGDWLTCFPGFAMLTADEPGAPPLPAGPAVGARCGELTVGQGVGLRWPDGEITEAVTGPVTGMGTA
jgi:AIR synthase-related protein